jgi:PAS domain S-box-containing protein
MTPHTYTFKKLKNYSAYVAENLLHEASQENLRLIKEADVPLLRQLSHLPEESILGIVSTALSNFLQQVQNDSALEGAFQTLASWRAGNFLNIPRENIEVTDIVLLYSIRKRLLLAFIPRYTTSQQETIDLILELEDFYTHVERNAFQTYVDIHQEILKEHQEELAAINEELKEQLVQTEEYREALDREHNYLNNILESVDNGIVACNAEGIITFFNRAAREFHSQPEQSLSPDEWASQFDLYQPDGYTLLGKDDIPLFQALQGKVVVNQEIIIAPENGTRRLVQCTGRQIFTSNGHFAGAVVAMQDITEVRLSEQKLKDTQEELAAANEELHEQLEQILHTKEALQESESRYRLIAENSTDLITIHTPTGECTYMSPSVNAILGYTAQELAGKTPYDLCVPEDLSIIEHVHQKLLTSNETQVSRYRLQVKSGEAHWFESYSKPIFDIQTGQLTGVQVTTRDITMRREAELALEQSHNFIEKVTNASPDLIFVTELGTLNDVYVNREILQVLGYPTEELGNPEKRKLSTLVHPDDLAKRNSFYQDFATASGKEVREVTYRIRAYDGTWRTLLLRGTLFNNDSNSGPSQVIGIAQDVTEKVAAEEEANYRMKQLLEAQALAHVGSFDWDMAKEETRCTPELLKIYGLPGDCDTLSPADFLAAIHPDDRSKLIGAVQYALENNGFFTTEYRVVHSDKTQRVVSVSGKVIFNAVNLPLRMIGTALDITDRKLIEEELKIKNTTILSAYERLETAQNELQKINLELETRVEERTRELQIKNEELSITNTMLIRTNTDLDNFIYTASHDLKSPILNLEGLIYVIEKKVATEDETLQDIIKMMKASVVKFQKTIKNLTEITKAQKNKEALLEDIVLDKALQDASMDIECLIHESGAVIETDFKVSTLHYAPANLRSILYNLLSNAIKYRSPDRTPYIKVSTYKKEGYVCLAVTDNGLGFDNNQKNKLFQMFQRLHDHVEGSGIGLYIIKRIIENQGGKLEAESTPNAGTTFTVYFKAKASSHLKEALEAC